MEAPTPAHRRIVDRARQLQTALDNPGPLRPGYWVTLSNADGILDRQFVTREAQIKPVIDGWTVGPGDTITVVVGHSQF